MVIRGKTCKVVGHGGMNMHMIDITDVPDAKVRLRAACLAQRSQRSAHKSLRSVPPSLHSTLVRRPLRACQRLCLS